jgi:hypothetical protein
MLEVTLSLFNAADIIGFALVGVVQVVIVMIKLKFRVHTHAGAFAKHVTL